MTPSSPRLPEDLSVRTYICTICGWIYDEAKGDPDSGIAPGTRFEDIPDDWYCPLCGVTKADFELYSPSSPSAQQPIVAPVITRSRTDSIVILGGGTAGWSVARKLRELDATVPITLVTACSGDIYTKPELSVALSRNLTHEKTPQRNRPAGCGPFEYSPDGRDSSSRAGCFTAELTYYTRYAPLQKLGAGARCQTYFPALPSRQHGLAYQHA